MTGKRAWLKVIGLCLVAAALGLIAFAASAQAKGTWKHNGATITDNPTKIVGEKDSALFKLLSKTGATEIHITCEKLTVSNGLLLLDGNSTGTLEFSECRFFTLNATLTVATEQMACLPLEPIVAKVKDLLFKHLANEKTYDLFSPAVAGQPFTTLHLGIECAFGELLPITGNVVIEGCKPEGEANGLESEVVKHLIQQAPENTELWTGSFKNELKYGVNAATLDGSEWLKLDPAGPLAGQKWSGVGITKD
jgi:hypothetical protein